MTRKAREGTHRSPDECGTSPRISVALEGVYETLIMPKEAITLLRRGGKVPG